MCDQADLVETGRGLQRGNRFAHGGDPIDQSILKCLRSRVHTSVRKAPHRLFIELGATVADDLDEAIEHLIHDALKNLALFRLECAEGRTGVLADGRVYSGPQALENGLIDRIATMRETIASLKTCDGQRARPRRNELRSRLLLADRPAPTTPGSTNT